MYYRLLALLWCALKHTGSPTFHGYHVFSPNQIGACRRESGVKDLSGGWSHSHPLHWWMGDSSQKDRVWRHHYQRGFPPLSTHEVKETLGCRLMTAYRQAGRLWQRQCFVYNQKTTLPDKISAFSQPQLCRDEMFKFTTGSAECKCVVPLFWNIYNSYVFAKLKMSVSLPLQGFCGWVWCFMFY